MKKKLTERLIQFLQREAFFLKRKVLACLENIENRLVKVEKDQYFFIVSCERNAGSDAVRCLNSVYSQVYQKSHIRHLFIDDASNNGTHEIILEWLTAHPDHNVEYIRNQQRRGGTANTVKGFHMAPSDAVVMELNGDDWLPDPGVAQFFNRIYANSDVWMTYNTLKFSGGPPAPWAKKWPTEIIRNNAFRDTDIWTTSALHTFRKRLFDHVGEDAFIDPVTGDYWECADDQAIYLSMFELAGGHSKNINRISYVYNFNEASHACVDHDKSKACAARIRAGNKYQPIDEL